MRYPTVLFDIDMLMDENSFFFKQDKSHFVKVEYDKNIDMHKFFINSIRYLKNENIKVEDLFLSINLYAKYSEYIKNQPHLIEVSVEECLGYNGIKCTMTIFYPAKSK